jgi:uncharacterized protein
VHQDGLVHVSELSDRFIKNPQDVVKVNQKVQVTVLAVDLDRKRISLSMKSAPEIASSSQSHHSGSEQKAELKKGFRKPLKEKPVPFNNPFADIFRKG